MYTVYSVHFTLSSVQCTLYSALFCTPYTLHRWWGSRVRWTWHNFSALSACPYVLKYSARKKAAPGFLRVPEGAWNIYLSWLEMTFGKCEIWLNWSRLKVSMSVRVSVYSVDGVQYKLSTVKSMYRVKSQLFQRFFPITDITTYRLNQPRAKSSEMHNKVGR